MFNVGEKAVDVKEQVFVTIHAILNTESEDDKFYIVDCNNEVFYVQRQTNLRDYDSNYFE